MVFEPQKEENRRGPLETVIKTLSLWILNHLPRPWKRTIVPRDVVYES